MLIDEIINFMFLKEKSNNVEVLKEEFAKVLKDKDNNEILKEFEKFIKNSVEESDAQEKKRRKLARKISVAYLISIFILLIFLLFFRDTGFEKKKIQKNIEIALMNQADVNILKSTLHTTPVDKITFQDFFDEIFSLKRTPDTYSKNITLEEILIEMRNNNYSSENFNKELNEKIKFILKESEKSTPIEKITKNQAEYFLNIKVKLSEEDYSKIENDLVKIIEDMSYNNKLINTYLTQSNKSYLISIIALIISAISFPVIIVQLIEVVRNYFNAKKIKKEEEKIKEKTNKKEE